jgi:hypothetical protein
MASSSELPSIYQLRIVLRGISPLIWRRLFVYSDTTLAQLHGSASAFKQKPTVLNFSPM